MYALKALIANLLAAKGLMRLRAGLRAHIKGLIIIIDLICNLLRSPPIGHLTQCTRPLKVSPPPRHRDVCLCLPLPVPASILTRLQTKWLSCSDILTWGYVDSNCFFFKMPDQV